jgi:hypothetical protein
MVHTAVVLPRTLLDQLRGDAERSERGLSTEIRQRLLSTYHSEGAPRDAETTELVHFIESLADSLARDLGKKWHESEYAKAALAGGVLTFLRPSGAVRDIPGHTDNPETVGHTHGRLIMAARRTAREAGHGPETD